MAEFSASSFDQLHWDIDMLHTAACLLVPEEGWDNSWFIPEDAIPWFHFIAAQYGVHTHELYQILRRYHERFRLTPTEGINRPE